MGKGIEKYYLLFLLTQELGYIKGFAGSQRETKEMKSQVMPRDLVGMLQVLTPHFYPGNNSLKAKCMLKIIDCKAAEPQIAGGYGNILEMSHVGLIDLHSSVSLDTTGHILVGILA